MRKNKMELHETQSAIDSFVHLNLLLIQLNKSVERRLNVSLVQLFVLLKLKDRPGISVTVFAKTTGVQPGTLSQMLRRLQRKNVLFVVEDGKDSRKKLIGLTQEGNRVVERACGEWQKIVNRSGKCLSKLTELQKTIAYLSELKSQVPA